MVTSSPPADGMPMRTAVVTGAASGIGRALSAGLAAAARVLITGSLAGVLTFPGGGAYPASEHALVAVAEQTALALEDTSVTVTLLCPALVRTGMSAVGADPADVATKALTACHSGRFLVMTG